MKFLKFWDVKFLVSQKWKLQFLPLWPWPGSNEASKKLRKKRKKGPVPWCHCQACEGTDTGEVLEILGTFLPAERREVRKKDASDLTLINKIDQNK